MRARARKGLVAQIPGLRVEENGGREQLQGFLGWVARFNSGKDRNIDLPNCRGKASRIALRFVSLLPSEEAGLELPHVKGVGEYGRTAVVPYRC